jgi:hypothetical protein
MITFHPAARKTSTGFIPMVTLRADKGRMVGSKVSQTGNVFASAAEAFDHALIIALRVAMRSPETLTVCKG